MKITDLPQDKMIVLFDGVCNLCNNSVQYIIKKDKKDQFRFASIQSEIGQEIINHLKIDTSKVDSIILYQPKGAFYCKAHAIMQIAKQLSGAVKMLSFFTFLPDFISNAVYDFIAKNRYKWFGKKDNCMLPTKEIAAKFLL